MNNRRSRVQQHKKTSQPCIVCGDLIVGYRNVGTDRITDKNGKIIGVPSMIAGGAGYAHNACKNGETNPNTEARRGGMPTLHKDADSDHCFKCGRDLRERGTKIHGIIGMAYRGTGQPVVACDDHENDLAQLYIKERREA